MKDAVESERKARAKAVVDTVTRALAKARCPIELEIDDTPVMPQAALIVGPPLSENNKKQPHKPKHVNLGRHGRPPGEAPPPPDVFRLRPHLLKNGGHEQAWSEWTTHITNDSITFTFWAITARNETNYMKDYPADWTWFPLLKTAQPASPSQCVFRRISQVLIIFIDNNIYNKKGLF